MYSSACMQNNRLTITQKAASTFFSWAKFTKKSGKKRKQFLLPTLRSVRLTDRDTWVSVCVWEWVRVCVSMCIFECVSALLLLLLLTSWPHTRICLTARDHDKWLFAKLRIFAQERRWTESDMHPLLVPSRTFCAFSIVTSTVWQSMVPTMVPNNGPFSSIKVTMERLHSQGFVPCTSCQCWTVQFVEAWRISSFLAVVHIISDNMNNVFPVKPWELLWCVTSSNSE